MGSFKFQTNSRFMTSVFMHASCMIFTFVANNILKNRSVKYPENLTNSKLEIVPTELHFVNLSTFDAGSILSSNL